MDGRLLYPALAAGRDRARGRLARLLAAGLAAGACLLGPAAARADDGLSIVAPSPGYAGATVDLVGCGFQAGEAVHLALDGGSPADSSADSTGCARWSLPTDPTIKPTVHMWSASGDQSGTAEVAPYVVNPAMAFAVPPVLPPGGGSVLIQGSYFAPGEEVDIIPADGNLVAPPSAFAGPKGELISAPLTLLPNAPPGTYVVTLRAHASLSVLTVQVVVTPPQTATADGKWTLEGAGTMDEPKSGAHTAVTLQLTLTASGGQVTGDGQYAGEVSVAGMTCTADPIPVSVSGTAAGGKLSFTGNQTDGVTMTIHCPGAPAMSFPMPMAADSGTAPPIEIEARDGATSDQDTPDVGGPIAHWHFTLHAAS